MKTLKGEVQHENLPDTPKKKANQVQREIPFERGDSQIE